MVEKFNHLRIEDNGNYVICYLSNPPTHTLTSSGVNEIHAFLDQIEKRDDLRVLAFTGDGNCAEILWTFMGISIPGWVLISLSFLLIYCVFIFKKVNEIHSHN